MITPKTLTRTLSVLISIVLVAGPAVAQQQKPTALPPKGATTAEPNAEAPTLDMLLAADSYKLYGEVRNLGQVIRSGSVADILDPVLNLAAPPKEFKSLIKFANTHAEALTTSRMLFAGWPVRAKLPQFLMAIEFPSAAEAQKFEPQLRGLLPKLIPPPTPTPTAVESPAPALAPQASATTVTEKRTDKPAPAAEKTIAAPKPEPAAATSEEKPAPPPFVIKQSANLVLITDKDFTFRDLRPKDSRPLTEDANFRQLRDRFMTEPLFVFFDVSLEDKSSGTLATATPTPALVAEDTGDEPTDMVAPETVPNSQTPEPQPTQPVTATTPPIQTTLEVRAGTAQQGTQTAVLVAPDASSAPSIMDISAGAASLMGMLFGGHPKYPEALGLAAAFDADGYVIRVLLVNGPEAKTTIIPFIPQVMSGPALAPGSPSILPADTELFIAASLDAPQTYDGMVRASNEAYARDQAMYRRAGSRGAPPEPPFAAFEKQLGIKIKEELLPVLGNELAVSIPVNSLTGSATSQPANQTPPKAQPPGEPAPGEAAKKQPPSPIIAIALKDKEAARALLPRIIDGLGFKGASTLAQTERHDDAEIVSYGNVLSYAFIGNYLVFSTAAATTRHVVDAFLNHQTLASDNHFRNYTRWQPRQVLGQVYVSPALMESYRSVANEPTALLSEQIREFLLRLSPVAEPVTYALSNEGPGPLHELHLPKNLVLMMVAGLSSVSDQSPMMRNEGMARASLSMIAASEGTYRANQGKGNYATLEQLTAQALVQKEMLESYGYKIELTVSGDKFEATAVPVEYGRTGRLSYFVDETSTIRAGDHAGGPATAADKQVQ